MSRRLDLALAMLCGLLAAEAAYLAPLNVDAAFTLRQARAQAKGFIPCRDIHCEYTPLVPTILAVARGEPGPSMILVQGFILACALLTYRLALTLGNPPELARRMALVAWALLLANEGRAIEFEPFTLVCLLAAANAFASSPSRCGAVRSGLWVGLGFWTKQYALVGWLALMAAGATARSFSAIAAVTAGVALGVATGFAWLLALGTELPRLWSLFEAKAYPPSPFAQNLTTAPDLVGLLILSYAVLGEVQRRATVLPNLCVPLLMSAAGLLPFYFRGYRHYWQLVIPFLVILLLQPLPRGSASWALTARRGALVLGLFSVLLDVGRCARDVVTQARQHQRAEAERLSSLANGSGPALYLVDPAVLAWIDTPIVALREVGPKFTRLQEKEARAMLAGAVTVVWDTAYPGSDELLRQLSSDPEPALTDRGFLHTRTEGSVRVYSRDLGDVLSP